MNNPDIPTIEDRLIVLEEAFTKAIVQHHIIVDSTMQLLTSLENRLEKIEQLKEKPVNPPKRR